MGSVKVGIVGLGTIGTGVYNGLLRNAELILRRTGVKIELGGVCELDPDIRKGLDESACPLITDDYNELLASGDIDIIVELIGGIDTARKIILGAFRSGKHVVTANKALLSESWHEIFEAARAENKMLNFEASAGGAIPVVRALRDSFVADRIEAIYGILNGTTNFILTEMTKKGCSFSEALNTAQEKGYAEKDPTLDISGRDSAQKLAILSLLAFGKYTSQKDIYTEGISGISARDLDNAEDMGYAIKLLAIAKSTGAGLELRVHPTLLPREHILSEVNGADNAVFIKGDLMEESLLFGKGAGQDPTASAVIADIAEIARKAAYGGADHFDSSGIAGEESGPEVKPMDEVEAPFYLRFTVTDRPGVLASIANILSENDISIASVSQERRDIGAEVPVVILTHRAAEGGMRKAICDIDAQDYVTSGTVMIRMEERDI